MTEKLRGSINVPLNEEGKKQASHLSDLVKRHGGLDEVHSSNMDRAKVTAEEVAKKSGTKNVPSKKLNPWHLGKHEGEEVNDKSISEINSYVKHPDKVPPKGGPESTEDPESFNSFRGRVLGKLRQLTAKAQATKKKIGAVGHFRTFRLWEAHVKAGAPKSLKVDHAHMASAPKENENTGHIAQISDLAGKRFFKPVKDGKKLKPGVYLMRHGSTDWNR